MNSEIKMGNPEGSSEIGENMETIIQEVPKAVLRPLRDLMKKIKESI